jgi:hypothetical protein
LSGQGRAKEDPTMLLDISQLTILAAVIALVVCGCIFTPPQSDGGNRHRAG